jgi:hypothetical protein
MSDENCLHLVAKQNSVNAIIDVAKRIDDVLQDDTLQDDILEPNLLTTNTKLYDAHVHLRRLVYERFRSKITLFWLVLIGLGLIVLAIVVIAKKW